MPASSSVANTEQGDNTNHAPRFGQTRPITRLSIGSNGEQANASSLDPMLAADGSFLIFASDASNLVDGDTNGVRDIFRKDMKSGTITRVSTNIDGVQANGASDHISLSADGTKLVFASEASNLVPGDTNKASDIFLKDLTTGAVTRVDITADGSQTNRGRGSAEPVISADGTKVAFRSWASNLVPGDTNGASDIFVKDLKTQTVTRISTTSNGTQTEVDNDSSDPVFSPDGTKVAFVSWAGNLIDGDTNGTPDIFIKDLTTEAVIRVSTGSDGTQANGQSASPAFSPDGTKIAFVSDASNLEPGDTNGTPDIFIKDLKTQAVARVSVGSDGAQLSLGGNLIPAFSPDGTKIAFIDSVSKQAYVKDLVTGALTAVAAVPNASETQHVAFSPDGSQLIFVSGDGTLVDGDSNGALDVFAAWTGQTTAGTVYDKASQVSSGTSGQLNFADPDANDSHTVTVKPGEGAVGTLTAKVTKEPGNAPGTIAWNYTVDHQAVAGLAKGQTKVETFTVTAKDGHGGTADQIVTITVVADNDTPHIDQFGPFTRLSIREDQKEANGASLNAVLSADGTKLVFASDADNLVGKDTNGVRDVFVKDLQTGAVTWVSNNIDGIEVNGGSDHINISSDGTKVVFISNASNLVPNDTNNTEDIFVKDLQTGAVRRISTASDGTQSDGSHGYFSSFYDHSLPPSFSPDGTKVVFASSVRNFDPAESTGGNGIFLKNLDTEAVTRVDIAPNGTRGTDSFDPVFSPDGKKIAFFTRTAFDWRDKNAPQYDVYIKDLESGTISCVSANANGIPGNDRSYNQTFSPDGTKIAFVSWASNLVPEATNRNWNVYLKDLNTGAISRVSTNSDGTELSLDGDLAPAFSPDGKKIAFIDGASKQVYVKDIVTGALTTLAPLASAADTHMHVMFSPDGSELIFTSGDGTLVPDDRNNTLDVFKVRIRQTTTGFVQDKADQPSSSTDGALSFTDPDIGDTHTVTVKPKDGSVGILTATVAAEPGDKAGSIAWTYTVDHKAVANLSNGQYKVETFTVTVDDGHGGAAEQVVTITVRGAAPPASSAVSTSSGSTTAATASQDHTDTVSTASTGSTEHTTTDIAHVQDTHHGYGLTGFEV